MKVDGVAGALVTAQTCVPLPTAPWRRPAHWPGQPRLLGTQSPICAPIPQPTFTPPAPVGPRRATRHAARPAQTRRAVDRPRRPRARAEAARARAAASAQEVERAERVAEARRAAAQAATRAAADRAAIRARRRAALEQAVRAEWETGRPQTEIAAALGISTASVQRLRRGLGLPRRHRAVDGAACVRLYVEDGLGVEAVAARLSTSSAAVRYRLRAVGVSMRPAGGAARVLPADVRERAVARLQAGESPAAIVRDLRVGATTLARWRRAAGIPARPTGRPRTQAPRVGIVAGRQAAGEAR